MISFTYWYLFPASIVIATIAMASGVEGATFFTPLFIIALKLDPEIAIGTGLITEVFGFASGLFAYTRKKLIDYKLGLVLLMVTVPLALFGSWAGKYVPPIVLKTILGTGLIVIALSFLRSPNKKEIKKINLEINEEYGESRGETCITTKEGEKICYTVCNKAEGMLFTGIGSIFIGMISTGLGELNGFFLLQRCKVPSRVAVATSVFVVAITALTASISHFIDFIHSGTNTLLLVANLVIFTIPGVIIGGQLGSLLSHTISQKLLEKILAGLFLLVAAFMLAEVIL